MSGINALPEPMRTPGHFGKYVSPAHNGVTFSKMTMIMVYFHGYEFVIGPILWASL